VQLKSPQLNPHSAPANAITGSVSVPNLQTPPRGEKSATLATTMPVTMKATVSV
jgi:hypothetical protein